jgi:uncharacterized RDD family membrane protein YckC
MSVHRKMWLYAAVCALTVSGGGQVLVAQAQEVAATSSAQALVIAPAAATHETGGDTVAIGNDAVLRADHQTDTLVSIFGSSRSDGEVSDSVVSVFGDTHVTGTVGDAVVAVFGNNYVNGHVGGDAVAVLGDLELGPLADVTGDAISIGGTVLRDPLAVVHGSLKQIGGAASNTLDGARSWVRHCLILGRPLAFAPGLGWAWALALSMLMFYVLMAAVLPRSLERCVATFAAAPGLSLLTGLGAMVATPVLLVLLCITIIGLAVIPFLMLGLFGMHLVGNAAMLGVIGRSVLTRAVTSRTAALWLAVLFGGLIVLGLYVVPVLGFIVYNVTGIVGFGIVALTLIQQLQRRADVDARAASSAAVPVSASISASEPAAPVSIAPSVPEASMPPFAGFWVRVGALLIDAVLVSSVIGFIHSHGDDGLHISTVALAVYGCLMWKLKGSTIGGIVFGLQIVRADGRAIDWATAIVRALSCFLSLIVLGLGFIWILFDRDHRAWHDMIAGTLVVRPAKGPSLV